MPKDLVTMGLPCNIKNMGFLDRRMPGGRPRAVQVLFRELQDMQPSELTTGGAYAYAWRLRDKPEIGQWVYVDGMDGKTTAVVVALGAGASSKGLELSAVLGVVPPDVVRRGVQAHEARQTKAKNDWYNQARRSVGRPTKGRVPKVAPERYPPVPPIDASSYDLALAEDSGRTWWRIYKQAEEDGLPPEDIQAFRSAAHAWYRRRDKLSA